MGPKAVWMTWTRKKSFTLPGIELRNFGPLVRSQYVRVFLPTQFMLFCKYELLWNIKTFMKRMEVVVAQSRYCLSACD
jgi:hypothetical protein